jgi:manganese efflux pump family protein
VLALLLVALSLGLSNFAASIAIGISGVDRALRVRIALAFGLFEAGMPIVGLLAGRHFAHELGSHAHLIGGGLLVATGAFTVVQAQPGSDAPPSLIDLRRGRLLLMAAALSIDNLIVGFALGAYHVPLGLAVSLIAIASVGLSLLGLELGAQLGARVEHRSELLAGIVLICVGVAIAVGLR